MAQQIRTFKLLVDPPFLEKGSVFLMQDSSADIYWFDNGKISEYPLRPGLAGYLWLLCTERKYMKLIKSEWE